MPLEEQAESLGGKLPPETIAEVRRASIEAGLDGGMHAREHGGQGWNRVEWSVVEEQFGRTTNAITWHVPQAYNVWAHASDEHIDRYLRPALRGESKDAYAVTERDAGSDPSQIKATAERTDAGYRINGEKWFVTGGDHAAVYVVMANLIDGADRLPTLFVVDASLDGIEIIDNPAFTHNYPDGHPTITFTDVEVAETDVIGGLGGGDEVQREWFTEERLGIAARCCGAMWRLLDETVDWTTGREQGGARVFDHQGVSFPLADSAADCAAGRLLTFTVAELADAGADPKIVHHKASMAKLFMSEAACRCADRCVQAFGGRGYMRSNVAERLLRELRVDRIWEGTSEIQRLIVARGLERRGVERMLH
jgi:alkylation response protein AidB-like acyl-CoA dehydrogenase